MKLDKIDFAAGNHITLAEADAFIDKAQSIVSANRHAVLEAVHNDAAAVNYYQMGNDPNRAINCFVFDYALIEKYKGMANKLMVATGADQNGNATIVILGTNDPDPGPYKALSIIINGEDISGVQHPTKSITNVTLVDGKLSFNIQ